MMMKGANKKVVASSFDKKGRMTVLFGKQIRRVLLGDAKIYGGDRQGMFSAPDMHVFFIRL